MWLTRRLKETISNDAQNKAFVSPNKPSIYTRLPVPLFNIHSLSLFECKLMFWQGSKVYEAIVVFQEK